MSDLMMEGSRSSQKMNTLNKAVVGPMAGEFEVMRTICELNRL